MSKKNVSIKLLAMLLASTLLTATGCSAGKNTSTAKEGDSTPKQTTNEVKQVTMPKKLRIFSPLSEHLAKSGRSNNDNMAYQLIQQKTGTEIEWIHPSIGSDYNEKFNLLIASKDLPDILWRDWMKVPGGIQRYVEDGIIIKLNDLITKQMPNYKKTIDEKPGVRKGLTTESGDILIVAAVRRDPQLMVFRGPVIRQDWLDKLKLKSPETMDDLYQVLKAFKTQDPNGNGKDDEWPVSGLAFTDANFGIGHLLWAFGIDYGFFQVDGKVKFGPLESAFTDAMTYINKLYKEGLLDPDYAVQDRNKLDGKFMNEQVGFEYGMQPTKMSNAMATKNPSFISLGVNHLRNKDGKPFVFDVEYTNYLVSFNSAAITTACKEPEAAAKWMDFLYSDEGFMLANFGKENDTYTLVNGKPVYTDKIKKNPEGLDFNSAHNKFTLGNMASFPYLMAWEALSESMHKNGAQSASTWAKSADTSRVLPLISFTQAEQEKIADKLNDINTYILEQYDKLVFGQTPISDIPKIQKKLKDMGIDDVLAVYNASLSRYNAKK
jgi:putative aldouronate transport system substrate-binding protein